LLALRHAGLGFRVQLLCDLGGTTLVGQGAHNDFPFGRTIIDLQQIAAFNVARRLDAFAVEPHTAGIDRIGRQRTRLEETRRPKPFIDANLFHRHRFANGFFATNMREKLAMLAAAANAAPKPSASFSPCSAEMMKQNATSAEPDACLISRDVATMPLAPPPRSGGALLRMARRFGA